MASRRDGNDSWLGLGLSPDRNTNIQTDSRETLYFLWTEQPAQEQLAPHEQESPHILDGWTSRDESMVCFVLVGRDEN